MVVALAGSVNPQRATPLWVIAVGGSAGGLKTLLRIVPDLPTNLPAAVVILLHRAASPSSALETILGRASGMPVETAVDRQKLMAGKIYVAPPGTQMSIEKGRVHLRASPRGSIWTPGIDALFESIAKDCGSRAIGVILSGMLNDGAAGLAAIKESGGTAIVQDPADAQFTPMIVSAMERVEVDHVVAAGAIPELLVRLTRDG